MHRSLIYRLHIQQNRCETIGRVYLTHKMHHTRHVDVLQVVHADHLHTKKAMYLLQVQAKAHI